MINDLSGGVRKVVIIMRRSSSSDVRLNLILNFSEIGLWDFDLASESCAWSVRTKSFFEIPPESKVTYGSFLDAVHPDDRDYVHHEIMNAVYAGDGTHYSIKFRSIGVRSGDERIIAAQGVVIPNTLHRASRIVGVSCDVTSRHRRDADLIVAQNSAEDAKVAKSQFLANVSHEFRTPLGKILGCADLAENTSYTADERGRFIGTIRRNGRELMGMVNDLLDLTDVSENRMKVELSAFLLKEALDDVVSKLRLKAEKKGLSIFITSHGRIPETVESDLLRFKQIVTNMMSNAIKFTEKGKIEVIVELVSPLKMGHRMTLRIAVRDSGIGIRDEHRVKLFEHFSQIDGTSTRPCGGNGIGLYLSKRIALALGGDLILEESTPGVGSTFVFLFPDSIVDKNTKFTDLSGHELPVRASATPSPEANLHGIQVLVVDDCEDNQAMLGHFLNETGAKVDFASNGFEAIEKAENGEHDIILMDIQMPILDGISATEQLRERGYQKPIIAVTSNSKIDDIRKSMRTGFNDHITKPINFKELLQEVARWVGGSSILLTH
jgi:signal transduction histidine kinase/CheY-like chemotaxis protein